MTLSPAERSALDELIGEVKKLWPKTKFKLFGLRVAGSADAESDIDILIQLPFPVTEEIRQQIIHKSFDINLSYESNISVLIVSQQEWNDGLLSVLAIHAAAETEGIAL